MAKTLVIGANGTVGTELVRLLGVAHHHRPAHECLRDALGQLPASRPTLIQQLSTTDSFGSPKP